MNGQITYRQKGEPLTRYCQKRGWRATMTVQCLTKHWFFNWTLVLKSPPSAIPKTFNCNCRTERWKTQSDVELLLNFCPLLLAYFLKISEEINVSFSFGRNVKSGQKSSNFWKKNGWQNSVWQILKMFRTGRRKKYRKQLCRISLR